MAVTYYYPDHYLGLSTDTKPTTDIRTGSTFQETDSSITFVYSGSAWAAQSLTAGNFASKSVTFTGAATLGATGPVPLFTTTGQVLVERIIGYGVLNLTEAAPTATLALGVTGTTGLWIGATNATLIVTSSLWVSTTPTLNGIVLPAAVKDVVITRNIIGTVAAQAVNGGTLRVDVWWKPLLNGSLVAS